MEDLPLPEEILDIVCGYLGEGDLDNLVKVGNERIKYCANRRLKKLSLIKKHKKAILTSASDGNVTEFKKILDELDMIGMTKEVIDTTGDGYTTALMNASREGHGEIVEL